MIDKIALRSALDALEDKINKKPADVSQCCGTCRHYELLELDSVQQARCLYPLPFWLQGFMPRPNVGAECVTWERRT